jgi:hypothetical protein
MVHNRFRHQPRGCHRSRAPPPNCCKRWAPSKRNDHRLIPEPRPRSWLTSKCDLCHREDSRLSTSIKGRDYTQLQQLESNAKKRKENFASANVMNLQRRVAGVLPVAIEVPAPHFFPIRSTLSPGRGNKSHLQLQNKMIESQPINRQLQFNSPRLVSMER